MSTDQSSLLGDPVQLSDRFVQHLAGEIAGHAYHAGDEIPAESHLAARYGVSKPTIRQGLKKLAALGLLRIQHGKRSVVLDEAEWNVLDPTVQEALTSAGRAGELSRHLWEMRELLETAAAGWAAERATDAQIDELARLVEELGGIAEGSRDVTSFLRVDRAFHDVVSRASGNPTLRCIIGPTHRFLASQLWSAGSRARPGNLSALAEQHGRIANAIRQRDAARARRAMAEHVTFAEQLETSTGGAAPERGVRG